MRLVMKCGHAIEIDPDKTIVLTCPIDGERIVARVDAPPPRIVGVASGPHMQTRQLPAIAVDATQTHPETGDPVGPLTLKKVTPNG